MQLCAETSETVACSPERWARRRANCAPAAADAGDTRGIAEPNKIKNMRPIAQRPVTVLDRLEPAHWEGGLIIGKKMTAAIAPLVKPTSR